MLEFLHIENIAVIESCDIEFSDGFNVLTGETGAGKSIIIDSINAVLGERTSKELIRAGCDTAEVSALFGKLNPENIEKLSRFDVFPDEDGNLLILRRLSLNGKNIVKINGKPSTVSVLKEIAGELVNIHGQHDSQALLDPERHCGFLDAVAENGELRESYYEAFKELNRIRKELQGYETDEDEKLRRIDMLKFQIGELSEANIVPGEVEKLKKSLSVAENYEKTFKALNSVRGLLTGDDDNDGILTRLKTGVKLLSELKNEDVAKALSKLNEAVSVAEEASGELASLFDEYGENIPDPDEINRRLDLIGKLMVKYGNSEEKMLAFLSDAETELENITFSDKRINELSENLQNAKLELVASGDKLTKSRKNAAEIFSEKVCEQLKYLNMPDMKFSVDMEKSRYTRTGCDSVEFKISANLGEEVKSLHKIASGGELSRIMLAIKTVLADKDPVGTMIFDEIDTGISGFAADKVGSRLKKASQNRQVICITHLAQIAARANTHLLISKQTRNGRTFTQVEPAEGEKRIAEIARIMSGTEITENIYNSAKELLDRSKNDEDL